MFVKRHGANTFQSMQRGVIVYDMVPIRRDPNRSKKNILLSETKALLFDLDGTIIDNMTHHHRAWQRMLGDNGIDWSLDQVKASIWGKNEEIFERVFPGKFSGEEAKTLSHEKELSYIEEYRPYIKMIDGLEAFLKKAKEARIKLAIATAAPRVCVNFVYEALDLGRYFDLVVDADQVIFSKPHPETYLTAARLLDESPETCLVFEDAPVGIRSAEGANMGSYVILTTHTRDEFSAYSGVRGFIKSYDELDFSA